MIPSPFDNPLSFQVWREKYRAPGEQEIERSWRRVARAVSSVEGGRHGVWEKRYLALLEGFRFLPGGRILAGAGTGRRVTLFNCFVGGLPDDDPDILFRTLKETAVTLRQGGGVGLDFSTLRPAGVPETAEGPPAIGPVALLELWNSLCNVLGTRGSRRGAMMASLRCDHPDIEAFIGAKSRPGALSCFNLSVQVTDAFMEAVANGDDWPLCFPADGLPRTPETLVHRPWSGAPQGTACGVLAHMPARALWRILAEAAWARAEPGVLFVDTIRRLDNLAWREQVTTTNPCGEIPLPPHGACDLGSLNLVRFVRAPFTAEAAVDTAALEEAAFTAVRFLDDVIDLSGFPLEVQARQARGSRRIGLGVTGLADALIMLGLRYDTPAGVARAREILRTLRDAAYAASVELAAEKSPYPWFRAGPCLAAPFVQALPAELRREIARRGLRNSHLLAIAPAGSISLLANNLSSGIEPVFALRQRRRVRTADGWQTFELEDAAWRLWRTLHPDRPPPEAFVTAREIAPHAHLEMQAALQPLVDNAISKTVNLPAEATADDVRRLFERAWRLQVKGCTVHRPNPVTGTLLESPGERSDCCRVPPEGAL